MPIKPSPEKIAEWEKSELRIPQTKSGQEFFAHLGPLMVTAFPELGSTALKAVANMIRTVEEEAVALYIVRQGAAGGSENG